MKKIKIGLSFFVAYMIATISYVLLLTSCANPCEPKMESYVGTLSASTRGFCHQTVPCWTVTIVGNGAPSSVVVYIAGDGKKWERNVTAWGVENDSHVNIYDMDPSIVGYSYQVLITR